MGKSFLHSLSFPSPRNPSARQLTPTLGRRIEEESNSDIEEEEEDSEGNQAQDAAMLAEIDLLEKELEEREDENETADAYTTKNCQRTLLKVCSQSTHQFLYYTNSAFKSSS